MDVSASSYTLGSDVRVDLAQGAVRRGDEVFRLTDIEAKMLAYLIEHTGRDIGRGELLERVWGYSPTVRSRAVDQTVKRLRPKIESDPSKPAFLQSVYGVGYRLVLPSTPSVPSPGTPADIPACPWALVGREEEISSLLDSISTHGLTNLTGGPGVGKSHLAWFKHFRESTPPIKFCVNHRQ